ncbi:hypothetical protein BDD12DRAFT_848990 [Trichophaea hybrida]|nr:hypothetical protein BDD12DRAFT_848990 [Trichophaea hybrida]
MATDVHEALKTLSPIEHTEFPSDPSALDAHLATSLADIHTLISSIPPPAILPKSLNLPEPPNTEIAALQNEWKPVKLSNKENQTGISVFKLLAKDGKGAWFARRSIHTNISFERFKAGLQHDFKENEGEGKSGPVRGIGKDILVCHESSELGRGEILQLSAQFPGPSAPRDFVEGCLSSSAHPEDHSTKKSGGTDPNSGDRGKGITKDRPRQFTLISKPVLNHPECDQRSGYVRGTYESVEFIREIPVTPKSLARCHSTPNVPAVETLTSPTRPRGKTVGQSGEDAVEAGENYPVEWVMITRSDPGGSVPRWMVERGTPGGIVKDAEKFLTALLTLDIAQQSAKGRKTSQESSKPRSTPQLAERKDPADAVLTVKQAKAELSQTVAPSTILNAVKEENTTGGKGGLLSNAFNSMAIGMTSLAQSMVSSSNPTPPPTSPSDDETPSSRGTTSDAFLDDTDDDGTETTSIRSFATCDSSHDVLIPEPPSRTPSVASTVTTASTSNQTPEERALAQFLKEKQKLDEKLKKEENRLTEREKKIAEKHLKNIEKQEKKYRRSLQKANEKRQKEEEKREREVQKKFEKEEKGRRKEVDELKKIVEGLTRENLALRQRIEDLEKEKNNEKEAVSKVAVEKVTD